MDFRNSTYLFFPLITLLCYLLDVGVAVDIITASQFIKDPETLSSSGANFTLGFFSPENSTNRYVGIWWEPRFTVIWVANRNQPLNSSSGIIKISEDGNLVILNEQKQVIWSSNVSIIASNSSAELTDYGSLVLRENTSGRTLWESFQHPSDAELPGMKLTSNKRTGEKVKLTSWKSPYNPSIGTFSLSVERLNLPEEFIWNESRPFWRTGPWNGRIFTGIPYMKTFHLGGIHVGDDGQGTIEFSYATVDEIGFIIYTLNSQGNCQEKWWDEKNKEWLVSWNSHQEDCDVYGACGPYAICNSQSSPICSCLRGFEPRNIDEWNRQNWTSGCVRRTPLQCERGNKQNTSEDNKVDGFWKLQTIKVPDFAEVSSIKVQPDTCRSQCLQNCSCSAYVYDSEIGCMSWTGNLTDIRQFSNGGLDLYVRVAHDELGKQDEERKKALIITCTVTIGIAIIVATAYAMWRMALRHPGSKKKSKELQQFSRGEPFAEYTGDNVIGELSHVKLQEILIFNFKNLATGTNDFHSSNKLGQGGFGPVYKGKLQDGQEIAVKRLSRTSRQGLEEFMNEVALISKLQHRNLVKLLGCCIEREEKILIYEYMPNKSLDAFVFDPYKSKLLDWRKCFNIIEGIARGLLYLHRDSRLKIIHRDLKASNILLDGELNPKISDFGMARIFAGSENQANTRRVVGTYGYMSPEYAMQGHFPEKSDVFSFGVLLLEIVSGRRNSSFFDSENSLTLLGVTWIRWSEDNILSLIDPGIYDPSLHNYILRCIHIGLLCVQEFAADRPTMAVVISMLCSEIMDLPLPRHPAFFLRQNMLNSVSLEEINRLYSLNTISITSIHGR